MSHLSQESHFPSVQHPPVLTWNALSNNSEKQLLVGLQIHSLELPKIQCSKNADGHRVVERAQNRGRDAWQPQHPLPVPQVPPDASAHAPALPQLPGTGTCRNPGQPSPAPAVDLLEGGRASLQPGSSPAAAAQHHRTPSPRGPTCTGAFQGATSFAPCFMDPACLSSEFKLCT